MIFSSFFKFFKTFKMLLLTFVEVITESILLVFFHAKQYKIKNNIERITKTSILNLKDNYILVGLRHLEILPHSGIFIENTHRLFDEYPRIVAIDSNKESLDSLEKCLEGTLSIVESLVFNISKQQLNLGTQFNSVSANFAFEQINENNLEQFIISIRKHLLPGGVFFGCTIAGANIPTNSKTYKYVKQQNDGLFWFNLHTTILNIENILNNHFDSVLVNKHGNCFVFRATVKRERIDDKFRLNMNNIEGKYLEL